VRIKVAVVKCGLNGLTSLQSELIYRRFVVPRYEARGKLFPFFMTVGAFAIPREAASGRSNFANL